jgi:hypothetical protein
MSTKASYKAVTLLVESGKMTQEELDRNVELGIVTQPRNGGGISVNPLEVSHNGKTLQVIPTLYFKGGSKIVPNTDEMNELRREVHKVISKYTSPEVDTADESKVKA